MKDDLSVLLASFAVYSNFYAIITIVLSFVAMTIFILRLNNGFQFQTSRENTNQDMMVEQPIIYQSNPFCITLSEVSPSSLKDGLAIYLSSLCSGNLTVFWGPKIEAVFTAMAQDSDTFLTDLEQGKYLQDKCLYAEHVKRLEPDSNQEIHIACPSEVEESHLGQTPRKQYSCILIAALPSSTQYHGSEIIATLSIVHLKDSLLSMESQVLNQFIKTADGKVYSVRPIYLATNQDNSSDSNLNTTRSRNHKKNTDTDTDEQMHSRNSSTNALSEETSEMTATNFHTTTPDNVTNIPAELTLEHLKNDSRGENSANVSDTSSVEESSDVNNASDVEELDTMLDSSEEEDGNVFNFPECIVCQIRPQSRALLPCRHACVCHVCLKQLTRCPMCRAYIESYFRLFHSVDDDMEESETPVPADFGSWLVHLNTRLNEYLGFT